MEPACHLNGLYSPLQPDPPFATIQPRSNGNVQGPRTLGQPQIMSPSGWLECGTIVLPRAIKPPSGQTRASLFLYEAQEGNKERSH